MKDSGEANAVLDAAVVKKISEHYRHAKAKHPYFADVIVDFRGNEPKSCSARCLKKAREILRDKIKDGCVQAIMVANVESAEIIEAFARGDKAHAVEECYDLIAVVLRMVDVLEGRQKLGNPESAKEAAQ